jgi:thioredoxin-like negative regulator of GroEL
MTMVETIGNEAQLQAFVQRHPAAAVYFAGEGCSVCTVLFPKLEAMLSEEFPRLGLARVECSATPDVPAQLGVFAVPSLILFFDGHEAQRYTRNFSLGEVRQSLVRPYQLLFD